MHLWWHKPWLFDSSSDECDQLAEELACLEDQHQLPPVLRGHLIERRAQVSTLLNAAEVKHEKHMRVNTKYNFIYASYKPHLYYWELIELQRKLILTGLIMFVKPGTATQLAVAFLIMLFFFVLQSRACPFSDEVQMI